MVTKMAKDKTIDRKVMTEELVVRQRVIRQTWNIRTL